MREIPLSVYADWPNPNYSNPVTRGDALLIVNIVFIILVTLSVIVRLYSRVMVKCQSGMDDVMIILAYICTVGLTIAVLLANRKYGWDRHIWDLPPSMIQQTSIVAFVAKLLFALASGFIRLSLIFLYYRLIRDTNARWYAYALHFNMALNVAIIVLFVLLCVFLCIPVQAYWQFPNVIEGKCLDEGEVLLASGIITCVADLLCTILPIPAVMRLRMPLRERIGVCFLLSAGIVVTIAGIVRTYFVYQGLVATYDETWYTYPLWICAAIEIHLAVICACVPSMKAVLWKPFRRWTSSLASHYRGTRTNTGFDSESQEPIRDSGYDERGDYQPHNFQEKTHIPMRNLDPDVLEKAIAQLPPPGSRHPHQLQDTACVNRCTENAQAQGKKGPPPVRPPRPSMLAEAIAQLPPPGQHHPHQLQDTVCVNRCTENARANTQDSQLSTRPSRPNLEINKETEFHVSRSEPYISKNLPSAPPTGQLPHRPRHKPLIPHQRVASDATPRDAYSMFNRRHAPAALPPSSPAPAVVAQNITSPLPPPTPMSRGSSLSLQGSDFEMTPKRAKRKAGTFFFG